MYRAWVFSKNRFHFHTPLFTGLSQLFSHFWRFTNVSHKICESDVKRLRSFAHARNTREPLFTGTSCINCESESDFLKKKKHHRPRNGSRVLSSPSALFLWILSTFGELFIWILSFFAKLFVWKISFLSNHGDRLRKILKSYKQNSQIYSWDWLYRKFSNLKVQSVTIQSAR